MSTEIFIQELTFVIIATISLLIAREFYISKDGVLRKISICYCTYEGLMYVATAIHTVNDMGVPLPIWRTFINIPKAIIWVWLLVYIRSVNKK